jgi:hypothetical protein
LKFEREILVIKSLSTSLALASIWALQLKQNTCYNNFPTSLLASCTKGFPTNLKQTLNNWLKSTNLVDIFF